MQRRLRVITLQGTIEKSSILLSQYWRNEWLTSTIIISYFGGSNNIFTVWIVKLLNRKHSWATTAYPSGHRTET